jgi:hypothetical protein
MSYETAEAALRTAIKGVTGVGAVVSGQPASVQHWPLVYMAFDGMSRTQHGQLTENRYRVLMRLCVPVQDNARVEAVIKPFVNRIPAAIDADPTLGGRVNLAYCEGSPLGDGDTYLEIAETTCRAVTFVAVLVEKGTYQSGI